MGFPQKLRRVSRIEFALSLKSSVRTTGIVARYGGDEFAILLPETEMGESEMLVKRMLQSIKNHAFKWRDKGITVEISYGISTTGELEQGDGWEEFIRRADSRLITAN